MAADTFVWNMKATINVSVIGRTIKGLTMDKSLTLSGKVHFRIPPFIVLQMCSYAKQNVLSANMRRQFFFPLGKMYICL